MKKQHAIGLIFAFLVFTLTATVSVANNNNAGARIKDITSVRGIRSNQLYGVGLVVGLDGTGAGSDLAAEMASNMMDRLQGRGLSELDADNISVVMVTAELPAFAEPGDKIDVTVNALDEAGSLRGGSLVMTPLSGADGEVYAVAQGSLAVGGFAVEGAAAAVTEGAPTVGRIPNGANVERKVNMSFMQDDRVVFSLNNPDFATATRMAETIQEQLRLEATVRNPATVEVSIEDKYGRNERMRAVSDIEMLRVRPDSKAVVVVNERTGTVVAGQSIGISTVAVSHGPLTVIVEEEPEVVMPPPFTDAEPVEVDRTDIRVLERTLPEQDTGMTVLNRGTTVEEVARALNLLGAGPREIISIFEAINEAGALHAELRVM